MSDPYGRSMMPQEPKKPRFFSPPRPVKYFIWFWMRMQYFQFIEGWSFEANRANPAFVGAIFTIVLVHALPVFLITTLVFSVPSGWSLLYVLGWILLQIASFLSFKLNDEEARRYWKDKLVD